MFKPYESPFGRRQPGRSMITLHRLLLWRETWSANRHLLRAFDIFVGQRAQMSGQFVVSA